MLCEIVGNNCVVFFYMALDDYTFQKQTASQTLAWISTLRVDNFAFFLKCSKITIAFSYSTRC